MTPFGKQCQYCGREATRLIFFVGQYSVEYPFHDIQTSSGFFERIGTGAPSIKADCTLLPCCSECSYKYNQNTLGALTFVCPIDKQIEEQLIKIQATQQQREINL